MTDIAIRSVTPATRDRWLSVAKACGYATYFHTPYWYEFIVSKQEYAASEVIFNDGASAIIPMAKIKRAGGLLTDNFSSPGGTYGGWISAAALNEKHIGVLFNLLTSKKNLTFRVNPFDKLSASLPAPEVPLPPSVTVTDDFTHALDLTQGIDRLRGGVSRSAGYAINVAPRNGLTVKRAETFDEWGSYYGLYLESVERWRTKKLRTRTVYPPELFRRIYENRAGNEILWIAMKDGEPVAGALIFYWNRHAVSWHGAASSRHFRLKPNNLLYWEIIKDAAGRGYEIFDFNPSGGYRGVESFKESFGAQPLPTPVITVRTPPRRMIAGLREFKKWLVRRESPVGLSYSACARERQCKPCAALKIRGMPKNGLPPHSPPNT